MLVVFKTAMKDNIDERVVYKTIRKTCQTCLTGFQTSSTQTSSAQTSTEFLEHSNINYFLPTVCQQSSQIYFTMCRCEDVFVCLANKHQWYQITLCVIAH